MLTSQKALKLTSSCAFFDFHFSHILSGKKNKNSVILSIGRSKKRVIITHVNVRCVSLPISDSIIR